MADIEGVLPTVGRTDIVLLVEKVGKNKANSLLAGLQKIYPELKAVFGTEVGQEILRADIQRVDELFTKVYNQQANELEAAEFKYLRDSRIPKIAKKLADYLEKIKFITTELRKE